MNTNPSAGTDSEPNLDQAAIARLHTTNPDAARWVENTLCEEHTLTTILDTEGYTLDPADDAAVERIATAIELWVLEIASGHRENDASTVDPSSGRYGIADVAISNCWSCRIRLGADYSVIGIGDSGK